MNRFHAIVLSGVLMLGLTAHAQTATTLRSDQLQVEVSTQSPQILSYTLAATGGQILGSEGKGTPSVVVSRRGGQQTTVRWADLSPKLTRTDTSMVFACTAQIGGVTAATFDYAIRLSGTTVTIETENIKEADGYDLNEFLFPADPLIRVTADMPGAQVCVGDLGAAGQIVAAGQRLADQYHFGLVYTDKAAAGIYSNSLYRQGQKPVHTLVSGNSTGLFANNHRYSYKDENFEPFKCQIGIVADKNADKVIDWKDAAIFIHRAIPVHVKLRQDRMKYMMNHGMDFASACEDVYRKICNLADGHPQMVLLSGWNGWGWDSEYPTWNDPGEEYGGREGLYQLHENANKYRAYTSMIHNFDDAYKNTRGWDDSIIAKRSDGGLWNATWWSGGPSYIIGPYRFYKSGKMKETIDGLISQGVEDQMFSDVFTILPWRSDEDRNDPTDAITNLVLGKFKLLQYLEAHDIYMNSEGFNYEMLGRYIGAHNGYNTGFTRNANQPPLANFICQGLLAKKYFGPSDEGRFRGADTEIPTPFSADNVYRWSMLLSFYGDKPMTDFKSLPDAYYARYGSDVEVTWKQGAGAAAAGGRGARGAAGPATAPAGAAAAGGGRRGGRGGGGGGAVSVSVAGSMICDGPSVLLPKPDLGANMWNVLRAYTNNGATMRYPKPKGWTDFSELTVMALGFDFPPQVISVNGTFKPAPDKEVPIQVSRDGDHMIVMQLAADAQPSVLADVAFEGDQLVLKIPSDRPIKLVYGPELVEGEKVFQPLPPHKPITYPLEEVVEHIGGDQRPDWIRLKTRKLMTIEPGTVLCVGASAVWPTKEEATKHAADIVAKKMAWFVRGAYVNRAREAERALNANTGSLGYDNWQLGYDGAVKMFTVDNLVQQADVKWYWEKVKAGPNREIGWKAFVCVPTTAKDGQQAFIESAKIRLAECQKALTANAARQRTQLELNIKVYEKILADEPKRAPVAPKYQV